MSKLLHPKGSTPNQELWSSPREEERTPSIVCTGLPCSLRGSGKLLDDLRARGSNYREASCLGYCDRAPVVEKEGHYHSVVGGTLSEIEESRASTVLSRAKDLAGYLDEGGYLALRRVILVPERRGLIEWLERVNLRGMGGAGFPAHVKWRALASNFSNERTLLVNAHEGEPGTFKDRVILERSPHLLIEGALIAAYVVGATRIVVALKPEYVNAARVLGRGLEEAREFLASSGLGPSLPAIRVSAVPGGYVTGEETALMEALEGRRSEPRLRPPFPIERGLDGAPTLVQNVETLSLLPRIFATDDPGPIPKVFCLTGDVPHPGAYAEDLGTSVSELIQKHGGNRGAPLKAFLPGGLSGGLLPASKDGISLDFDALRKEGGGLGTGAVIAIGEDRCIVQVLASVSKFFAAESCGKCAPCRLGTRKLQSILISLANGTCTADALKEGLQVSSLMQETSLCALGQVAGKTFLDAHRYLEGEVQAHLGSTCPAGVCHFGGA